MLLIKKQKYFILFCLFIINLILSTTSIIYSNKWYIYIVVLIMSSLLNSISAILNLFYKMKNNDSMTNRIEPKNYIYVIPCYNESYEELYNTINSLVNQRVVPGDRRSIIIICDGNINTSNTLKKLLDINENKLEKYEYTTWDNTSNIVETYNDYYYNNGILIPYILIIKTINYGKRDSLVLARKLCYNYNTISKNYYVQDEIISNDMTLKINNIFKEIYKVTIEYIIGIDADTIFDYNCSYELINELYTDNKLYGCVGLVSISPQMKHYNLFILYQYAEYMYAQCLRRYTQAHLTNKVSCLSGCNQILRITKETCGPEILKQFNYLPEKNDNIFKYIRSYASEDRNHVCHMLSMYPYVKTGQNIKAIAYTIVPTSISVFLSQRRRWSLGANTNDILLVYLPGINIFERIAAFINCMTFMLTPFIFISTIMFIHSIVTSPSYLMLYLGILVIIPIFYAVLIPIFINPLSFRTSMYFYISYLFFLVTGSIVGMCIYIYSMINIDIIKWGKTRKIIIDMKNNNNDNNIDRYIDDEIYISNTNSILRFSLV